MSMRQVSPAVIQTGHNAVSNPHLDDTQGSKYPMMMMAMLSATMWFQSSFRSTVLSSSQETVKPAGTIVGKVAKPLL